MSKVRPDLRRAPAVRARDSNQTWQPRLRLWIDISGRGSLGPGKFRLLEAIDANGSLSVAARQLGMSYRLAWQRLRLVQQRTGIIAVEPRRGGRHGGGTDLTPEGKALLAAYQRFRQEVEKHMQAAFQRHFAGCAPKRSAGRQRA